MLRRLLLKDKERILPQEWHCSNKPVCVSVASTEGLNPFGWRLQWKSYVWNASNWFDQVNSTFQQSSKHSWPWKLSIIIVLFWIWLRIFSWFQPDRTDKHLCFIWGLDTEFDFSLLVCAFLHWFSISLRAFLRCLVGWFQTLPRKWRQSLVRWEAHLRWILQGGKGHQHHNNAKKTATTEAEICLSPPTGEERHYLFHLFISSTTISVFLT